MANKTFDKVMRHIRLVGAVHAYRGLSDRELLDRFTRLDDEAAFTVIVDRHGPMVLGICHRALGNVHDAEDVCQATILVLAHKASTIRKSTSLSSWLHGVACRAAVSFTRAKARRECRERKTEPIVVKDAAHEVSLRETQSILDEELEQLPERFRAPLILCYLDGKTRDEAAQQLGLMASALHGRLERGRNMLRERLARRGLTLSGGLFAATLGESGLRGALPASFVISSAKAAMALIAGQTAADGEISATVLTLMREVLKTMFLAKLKIGTAAVICASLIATVTCGTLVPLGVAQDVKPDAGKAATAPALISESDEAFIRRMSQDLRGNEPTPTEIHFFEANRDAGKRQKLIDLLILERQARKKKATEADAFIFEGTLLPIKRLDIYAPMDGIIVKIREGLKSGSPVAKGEELLLLKSLKKRTNSTDTPGEFKITSPIAGIILTPDFQETLLGRSVTPNEPLLRVGYTNVTNPKLADWEIELKIPRKHIGQFLEAIQDKGSGEEMEVDFMVSSLPTRKFKGKLLKSKIASVHVNRDGNNKGGLVALVRVSGSDIPEEYRLIVDMLVTGSEIRARIRSRPEQK